jgi:hypothetical protein
VDIGIDQFPSKVFGERESGSLFTRCQDGFRGGGDYSGDSGDLLLEEATEGRGVPNPHFDEIAIAAGDEMDLLNIGQATEPTAHCFIFGSRSLHVDESDLGPLEVFWVESNLISVDNPLFFQFADSLKNGRWREADLSGHFDIGDACFVLEDFENFQADCVKHL